MKARNIARITTIAALLFLLAIMILTSKLAQAKNELEIANQTVMVCDEQQKQLEKKLYFAEEVIYEYREMFPTSFMDAMHIDTERLNELYENYKAIK